MLKGLGRGEVDSILQEQGKVEVTCEYCGQRYVFLPDECQTLFE